MVVEEVCFACCCVFAAGVNLLVGCFPYFPFFFVFPCVRVFWPGSVCIFILNFSFRVF